LCGQRTSKGSKDCLLHGEDCSHSINDCYTLKAQAKRMRNTYDTQAPEQKKQFKKKQELHAIIEESVEKYFEQAKKKQGKRKCNDEAPSDEESVGHYAFDKLSVNDNSDSD